MRNTRKVEQARVQSRQSDASKQRDLEAWRMRRSGHTYRAIGERYSICGSRARQLVWREEQRRTHVWPRTRYPPVT